MNLLYLVCCIIVICSSYGVEPFDENDTFYYFAYGSNLLAKRLHLNNPSAIFYSIAKLREYRLDFITYRPTWNGAMATIVEDPGTVVWGALWVLDVKDMKNLDKQEEVDVGLYYAKNVTVITPDGITLKARTYQQTVNPPKVPSYLIPPIRQPSKTYIQVILYGAFESFLPLHYIKFLFTFPSNNNLAVWSLRESLGYPFNVTEPY